MVAAARAIPRRRRPAPDPVPARGVVGGDVDFGPMPLEHAETLRRMAEQYTPADPRDIEECQRARAVAAFVELRVLQSRERR